MTQNKDPQASLQGLFEEVVTRGMNAGATTQNSYDDLVAEVIEEHRSVGELNDDQDLVGMAEQLRVRFGEYIEQASS